MHGLLLTFWRCKVNDIAIILEHVDLLNCLDRLHIHLLQRGLQLLIVRAGALVRLFGHLAARSAFASASGVRGTSRISLLLAKIDHAHVLPFVDGLGQVFVDLPCGTSVSAYCIPYPQGLFLSILTYTHCLLHLRQLCFIHD